MFQKDEKGTKLFQNWVHRVSKRRERYKTLSKSSTPCFKKTWKVQNSFKIEYTVFKKDLIGTKLVQNRVHRVSKRPDRYKTLSKSSTPCFKKAWKVQNICQIHFLSYIIESSSEWNGIQTVCICFLKRFTVLPLGAHFFYFLCFEWRSCWCFAMFHFHNVVRIYLSNVLRVWRCFLFYFILFFYIWEFIVYYFDVSDILQFC